MENISLKAICLGVLSYLLPFIIMAIYLFIKLADVFFSGVSGRERVDLDFLNNEYLLVAFIIIPIISGYISMRISNKESYVNPAIVGVIIIGFNLWLYTFDENRSWSNAEFVMYITTISGTLFGGYLALRRINQKKHNKLLKKERQKQAPF